MKNIDLNSVVLCSTGRVGIVSGFEDYNGLPEKVKDTRVKPQGGDFRYKVEFSDGLELYFWERELELFEG